METTILPTTRTSDPAMDNIDAFAIFPTAAAKRGRFRACWVFQTQRHAESHLRRADDIFTRRDRRPLPSQTHAIFEVQITDPETVVEVDFIPAIAILKGDSLLFQGTADWYNMRLFHDEKAAMANFNQNYTEARFRMIQVALRLRL